MPLYLVQHGKCLSKEEDPDRNLTYEGINEVNKIAEYLKQGDVKISIIKHSGKKRAEQTAQILADVLYSEKGIGTTNGINPNDDVVQFTKEIDFVDNVMIVGHLPFLEKLVSYLIQEKVDNLTTKFQNAGVVCIDKNADNKHFIKWFLVPNLS